MDTLNESTLEEEGSDEYDEYEDNTKPNNNKVYYFSIDRLVLVINIILLITRKYKEVFPKVKGKRRLNPNEFEVIIRQLRSIF